LGYRQLVMKSISVEQVELIDAVLAEKDVGGLTAAIFEKDIHLTDASRYRHRVLIQSIYR
jgi:hypothetical protein